jgi:hypothetical protein
MAELTPENFRQLAKDVTGLDKALGELKGSIDGLKLSHSILVGTAAIVGGLFLAALIYMGSQVGSLDTRVDGVFSALGNVQGELRAINQRLMVLEEIRDRIEGLASVEREPAVAPSGDAFEPNVASSDGIAFAGYVDASDFASAIEALAAALLPKPGTVRMVGIDAPPGHTQMIYSPANSMWMAWGAARMAAMLNDANWQSGFPKTSSIEQFIESVEAAADEHPEGGILLISTGDPELQSVAGQYGISFDR